MSATPGYGETPVGSGPEQPEWLRKETAASPSSGAEHASQPPAGGGQSNQFDGYGNPIGLRNPPQAPGQPTYQAPYATPPQTPYQGQYPAPPQYPAPAQHPAPPQYQSPYPAPQPGPYPPVGSPWAPVDPRAKSRLAAGLLGIFLGSLGIHRFYLGYTGVGIVMLLMTLLSFGLLAPVTSIWGLVEGILYLTDKTGRYSRDATGRPLRD